MNGDIPHLIFAFLGGVPQEKVDHDAVDLTTFMIIIIERFVSQQSQHFPSNQLSISITIDIIAETTTKISIKNQNSVE